jgi:uncharacterized delta-60 repeat protein
VEFLEQRQLLTNILATNATPEQLAANVSDLSWVDTDQALATAVQSDGKIVLVGSAEITADGDTDFAVTRLNADGTLDLTFGTDGKKTIAFDLGGVNCDVATCVAIQSDGKIVIGGYAQRTISGNFDFALVRLNTDGSLDNSFSTDGKATVSFDYGGTGDDRASGIAIQPDGRIVIVGDAKVANDGRSDFAMARLTTSGDLDTTFSVDGLKRVDFNGGDCWQRSEFQRRLRLRDCADYPHWVDGSFVHIRWAEGDQFQSWRQYERSSERGGYSN